MAEHNPAPVYSSQILKGIPLMGRGRRKEGYPFETMEIGDAFFTENKSISGYCSSQGKKLGRTFVTRSKYEFEGRVGIMVWRTA